MSFEHSANERSAPAASETTTADERLAEQAVQSATIGAQEVEQGFAAPEAARKLVRTAVLRGLLLDDPWRHAFLRNRWIGA